MRAWIRTACSGAALVVTAVDALAQVATTSLTVSGGLAGGHTVEVRADRPSFVTLFAVGRSEKGNPLLMLLGDDDAQKARKRVESRRLRPSEMLRLADASEVVVVALASAVRPNLTAFQTDGAWASDLLLADSATVDGKRLIAALADAVYPRDVVYAARILPVDLETAPTVGQVVLSTNACGELVATAAPTMGDPRSSNGVLLPGATDSRAFNPTYSVAPVTLTSGPPASGDKAVSGNYVVSRLQLPGCTVLQYVPLPAPPVREGMRPQSAPATPTPPQQSSVPVTPPPAR